MYICVCNAVTESEIRKAVSEGASNFNELSFATGCGTQCGSCVPLAREVMDDERARTGQDKAPVSLHIVSSSWK